MTTKTDVTECRKCHHTVTEELPVLQDSELCGNCDREFWTWVPTKRALVVFPDKKTMVDAVVEFIG